MASRAPASSSITRTSSRPAVAAPRSRFARTRPNRPRSSSRLRRTSAAVGPGARALALLERDGHHGLRAEGVPDRVAAGRLRGVTPGSPCELEGAAVLAAAADRVRVLARLALGGVARPALVAAGGVLPHPLVLAAVAGAGRGPTAI